MMKKLKLGIIGMSEGNGHPYSWSAIFNGYNEQYMKECPFPVIPEYLSKQKFPRDAIHEAEVTHIWTQERSISEHIALACNIPNIVDDYKDMIGKVDAILLARDDAENHYELSKPFLLAGLPVYIDKPIATSIKMLEEILSLEQYEGQIFSCSALSYAKEFQISEHDLASMGQLRYVDACVMKSFEKYAVHVIEPVLKMIGNQGEILRVRNTGTGSRKIVTVDWESGLQSTFVTLGNVQKVPIKIRLFGDQSYCEYTFSDTFYAFKQALQHFIDVIKRRCVGSSKKIFYQVVKIIEEGQKIA